MRTRPLLLITLLTTACSDASVSPAPGDAAARDAPRDLPAGDVTDGGVDADVAAPDVGACGARLSAFTQRVSVFDSSTWVTTDTGAPVSTDCVNVSGSVPWTLNACCATCPTFGSSFFTPPRPMVSYLTTPDEFGNVVSARCAGAAPMIVRGYYAVSNMEYYTR